MHRQRLHLWQASRERAMAKKLIVRAKLESVAPQRQQYRPYLFNLQPEEVYLEMELAPDQIIEQGDGKTVINVEGFKAILASLADAVDQVHDAYVVKARKAG